MQSIVIEKTKVEEQNQSKSCKDLNLSVEKSSYDGEFLVIDDFKFKRSDQGKTWCIYKKKVVRMSRHRYKSILKGMREQMRERQAEKRRMKELSKEWALQSIFNQATALDPLDDRYLRIPIRMISRDSIISACYNPEKVEKTLYRLDIPQREEGQIWPPPRHALEAMHPIERMQRYNMLYNASAA